MKTVKRISTRLAIVVAVLLTAFALLVAALPRTANESLAYASDAAEVETITLTGKGSTANPYPGYISSSAQTWVSVSVPCLFGGGQATESSPSSYSVLSFKVRVSGVYKFAMTAQTYKNAVDLKAALTSSSATLKDPVVVSYNSGSTSSVNVFEAELKADTTYNFRISGTDNGYDVYVRYVTLDYLGESENCPIPAIALNGVTENVVAGTLGGSYVLPEPSVSDSQPAYVSVTSPSGKAVVPRALYSGLTDKSFTLDEKGNYIIVYSTDEKNYASKTYAVRVAPDLAPSDKAQINALDFASLNDFSVVPAKGVGGSAQKSTGSMTFKIRTYESLRGSKLSLSITAVSDKLDNAVAITLDDNPTVNYVFTKSDSATTAQTYAIGEIGALDGAKSSSEMVSSLTITALTENGSLTLGEISASVEFGGALTPLFTRSVTDIYRDDADAEFSGKFTETTSGLMGFSADKTSSATYPINLKSGGEYYVVAGYTPGSVDSSVTLSVGDEKLSVALPASATSTSKNEYDAYKMTLPAGESTLTLSHGVGKGYYVSSILICNDLTTPEFTLSSLSPVDVFAGESVALPYAVITDNDPAAFMIAAVVSDNAEYASITGRGTASEPFSFTASREGEYVVSLAASDSVSNVSEPKYVTVFVAEPGKPVISVDLTPVTVRSGYLMNFPSATARFNGADATSSITVTLYNADGDVVLNETPLSEATFRAVATGEYTLKYSCSVTEAGDTYSAYEKSVPVTVVETARLDGASSDVTLSGGFTASGTDVLHPGDAAYAQADSISFAFSVATDGEFIPGITAKIYSTSYVLYFSFDGGDYVKLAAESSSDVVEAFAAKSVALSAGKHTLKILAGTAGGDAWLSGVILKNVESGNRKIFTADEIYADPSYSAHGDVRYSDGTLGRLNLNPAPSMSASVIAEVSGDYRVTVTYFRTSVKDDVPVLNLAIGGADYELRLDAADTAAHALSGTYYFAAGENALTISGVDSRGYAIKSVAVEFVGAREVAKSTIVAAAPGKTEYIIGETIAVGAASLSDGSADDILLTIKFDGATFYSGENKALELQSDFAGTYEIVYSVRSSSGKYADKLVYRVTVAEEKTDETPVTPDKSDETNGGCGSIVLWSSVSVGSVLIIGLAVFLILKFRRRK